MAEGGVSGDRFVGKTIAITGAAGDIGSATAQRFAREGSNIVLVDLNTDSVKARLEELSCELERLHKSCSVLVAVGDVRSRKDMDSVFERACQTFGRVDFVFNNAGVQGGFMPTDCYNEDNFRQVLDVNIVGVYVVMQAAVACIKESRKSTPHSAVIVNTSSLAGLQGPPNMLAYAAAKHAVIGMTRTAAKDLAVHGIRVCAIAPGLLEGRMWDSQVANQARCRKSVETGTALDAVEVTDEDKAAQCARMIGGTALKRLGTLDEVAAVVAFLCSNDASYLTGNVMTIDGGRFC